MSVAAKRRQRGIILMLALVLGVGLAAVGARTVLSVSPEEQGGRVDALFHLVRTFRLLWAYQFTVSKEIDPQTLSQEFGQQVDAATLALYKKGYGKFNRDPAVDWSSPSSSNATVAMLSQQWHPVDFGYSRDVLACEGVCWDFVVDTFENVDADLVPVKYRETQAENVLAAVHFWLDVGSRIDLEALLHRLRVSEWTHRAGFCPTSRKLLNGGDATAADGPLRDPNAVFTLRCTKVADRNRPPEEGETVLLASWTLDLPRLEIDTDALVFGPEFFLYNLSEVSAYRLYPSVLHPGRGGAMPVSEYLSAKEVREKVIRIQPYQEELPDLEGFNYPDKPPANSTKEGPITYSRCYQSYREKIARPLRQFTPTGERAVHMPGLPVRCETDWTKYAHHLQEYDNYNNFRFITKAKAWTGSGTLTEREPIRFEPRTTGNSTSVGEGDDAIYPVYPPHLSFTGAQGNGPGPNLRAGAATVRGSIIAKWLYIKHLMGSVYLAPGIGPRPKDRNDEENYENDLAWLHSSTDMLECTFATNGDTATGTDPFTGLPTEDDIADYTYKTDNYTDRCAYLRVTPGTIVLSESITDLQKNPSSSSIQVVQSLPQHAPLWHTGDFESATAFDHVRPYVYEGMDGRPSIGLLAQEVQSYYPHAVKDAGGSLAVGYYNLLPVLHRQLQQLRSRHAEVVEKLQSRLAMLRTMEDVEP